MALSSSAVVSDSDKPSAYLERGIDATSGISYRSPTLAMSLTKVSCDPTPVTVPQINVIHPGPNFANCLHFYDDTLSQTAGVWHATGT